MRREKRAPAKPKATTQDIVGAGNNGIQVPEKWRHHYDHLMRLRDSMLSRQSGLARDAIEEQPTFGMHMADAGTDTFDRDLALGMLSNEQDVLYQIEQALDRIRRGNYGVCEVTGKPIESDRLKAVPWTRFSKAVSEKLEQEGVGKRARLGDRDSVAKAEPPSEEPDVS
jgi:RNA polymerase-binding transcription factor DksA